MFARKYEITKATTVLKMIIDFNKLENGIAEPITIHVGVDVFGDQVFFDDHIPGIDYKDLEQEILASLRPKFLEQPKLPSEAFKRVEEVKAGNYGNDFPKHREFIR